MLKGKNRLKKLVLALSVAISFSSTSFFAGCSTLNPNTSTNQEQNVDNALQQGGVIEQTTLSQDEYGYYLIYKKEDFAKIKGASNKIKLCADIDFSGQEFSPITANIQEFDGQGYKISGVTNVSSGNIAEVASDTSTFALFSKLKGTTIKNLTLENFNLVSRYKTGALAVETENSTIENVVVVNSTIKAMYSNNTNIYEYDNKGDSNGDQLVYAGGLVAKATDTTFTNCMGINNYIYAGDNTNYQSAFSGISKSIAGGIVGEFFGKNIDYCLTSGKVESGILPGKIDHAYAGGITGLSWSQINGCQNNCEINAGNNNVELSYAGGISGSALGEIKNCLNESNVTAVAKKIDSSVKLNKINSGSGDFSYNRGFGFKGSGTYDLSFASGDGGNIKPINASNSNMAYNNGSFAIAGGAGAPRFSVNLGVPYNVKQEMSAYSGGISGFATTTVRNSYSKGHISGGYSHLYLIINIYLWHNDNGIGGDNSGDTWRYNETFNLYATPISNNADKTNYFSGNYSTSVEVNVAPPYSEQNINEIVYSNNIDNYNKTDFSALEASSNSKNVKLTANIEQNDNTINIKYNYTNTDKANKHTHKASGTFNYFKITEDIGESSSFDYDSSNLYTEDYIGLNSNVQKLHYATKYLDSSKYSEAQKKLIYTEYLLNANYSNKNNNTWVLQADKFLLSNFYHNPQVSTNLTGYSLYENCWYFGDSSNPYQVLYAPANSTVNATNLKIHQNTVAIGAYSFFNNTNFTGVLDLTSYKNIKDISMCAFEGTGITSVKIGKNVKNIERGAFYGCKSLINLTVENDSLLEKMGYDSFAQCSALTTVVLPCSKLNNVYDNVFWESRNISSIELGADISFLEKMTYHKQFDTALKKIIFTNTASGILKKDFVGRFTSLEYLDTGNISEIEDYAFKGKSIITVIIGKGMTNIGYDAFCDCSKLSSLTFVTATKDTLHLERGAFFNCDSLTSVVLPNRIKSLEKYTFAACNNLKNFLIEAGTSAVWDETLNDADGDGDNEWKYKIVFEYPNGTTTVYKNKEEWDKVTRYEDCNARWTKV